MEWGKKNQKNTKLGPVSKHHFFLGLPDVAREREREREGERERDRERVLQERILIFAKLRLEVFFLGLYLLSAAPFSERIRLFTECGA